MNNVVGKTLIVMQLVFSLCFMCFAGAVYTFQSGWKAKAVATEGKLKVAQDQVKDLQKSREDDVAKLTADLKNETTRAEMAEAQVTAKQTSLDQAIANLANAEQQRDKFQADLVIAQQEAEARITETNEYRSENSRLRDQVNEGLSIRRGLEDQLLESRGQLDDSKERLQERLNKIVQLKEILRYNKIDPDAPIAGPVPPPTEKVTGIVTASRKNDSRTAELVQISVGSDDNIAKGMRLIVYRGAKFVCEIEILKDDQSLRPDFAVGRVIEETRNGNVERGDHVTTKL
jgi:hypothetical protein